MTKEHYIVVDHISEAARQALVEADCFVHELSADPPLIAVALRYQDSWSKEHYQDDLETFSIGEIAIHSTCLHLFWIGMHGSVTESRLITPHEDVPTIPPSTDDELGELDDQPF